LEHWHLAGVDWLRRLPAPLADELRRASSVRCHSPRESIFGPTPEPKHIWLLENGLVRVFRSIAERDVTLWLIRPGQVFGEIGVLRGGARHSSAIAVRRSTVWRMSREPFLKVLRADSSASFEITKTVAGRLSRIECRMEDLLFRSAGARVARALLQLGEEFGKPIGPWIEVDLPINQSELATLVGAARQTVNETLRDFTQQNLVGRERGRLLLLDPAGLEKRASEEGDPLRG
jgi:CRP-like cAMP-binding protein